MDGVVLKKVKVPQTLRYVFDSYVLSRYAEWPTSEKSGHLKLLEYTLQTANATSS